jgi:hypothetical protein
MNSAIAERLQPVEDDIALLDSIPGVNRRLDAGYYAGLNQRLRAKDATPMYRPCAGA